MQLMVRLHIHLFCCCQKTYSCCWINQKPSFKPLDNVSSYYPQIGLPLFFVFYGYNCFFVCVCVCVLQLRSQNYYFWGAHLKKKGHSILRIGYNVNIKCALFHVFVRVEAEYIAWQLKPGVRTSKRSVQITARGILDWFNFIVNNILFNFSLYLLWLTSHSCSQYNHIQTVHAITENITWIRWSNLFLIIVYGLEIFIYLNH